MDSKLKISLDSNSKLKILGGNIINGLLAFDGIDDLVYFEEIYSIDHTNKLKLNFYIPSIALEENHNLYITYFSLYPGNDSFFIYVDPSFNGYEPTLRIIYRKDELFFYKSNLPIKFVDNILELEIYYSFSNIENIYLNKYLLTPDGSTSESFTSGYFFILGAEYSEDIHKNFWKGYIWNVEIYDGSTLEHFWKGYPDGNTNEAWKDLAGSAICFICGNPTTDYLVDTLNIKNHKLLLTG